MEESFTNFQKGINWRSYVVCDVAYKNVNNWLWTPFIERGHANRIYIEIKFTIRDCSLFPGEFLYLRWLLVSLLHAHRRSATGIIWKRSFASIWKRFLNSKFSPLGKCDMRDSPSICRAKAMDDSSFHLNKSNLSSFQKTKMESIWYLQVKFRWNIYLEERK